MIKPLSPTTVILVSNPIDISHLNSILMLGDCVGEKLTLQVELRCWPFKQIKIPSFSCKVPMWCVFTEKCKLRWNGTLSTFSLCVCVVFFYVCGCKGGCVWRGLCAWILWGNIFRSVTGTTKSDGSFRSNQFIGGT